MKGMSAVKSLFTKIFLWFLFTMLVTFVVSVAVTNVLIGSRQQQPWDNRMLSYQLYVARQAWEQRGRTGLEAVPEASFTRSMARRAC